VQPLLWSYGSQHKNELKQQLQNFLPVFQAFKAERHVDAEEAEPPCDSVRLSPEAVYPAATLQLEK